MTRSFAMFAYLLGLSNLDAKLQALNRRPSNAGIRAAQIGNFPMTRALTYKTKRNICAYCSCPPTYKADQRLISKLPSGRLDAFNVLHKSRLLPPTFCV